MLVVTIVCVLMGASLVALEHCLRPFSRTGRTPKARFAHFAQEWMWQLPLAMGYGYFPDADVRWRLPDTPTVWRGAQIVLATEVGEDLVLDCLVSGAAADAAPDGVGQPLTLWTHRLVPLTLDAPEGGLVSAWTDAGTPVNIFCDHHGDTAHLRICHGSLTVNLALDDTT